MSFRLFISYVPLCYLALKLKSSENFHFLCFCLGRCYSLFAEFFSLLLSGHAIETSDRSAARAKWSEFPSKLNDLRQPLNPAETAWRPTRRLAANNDHTVLDTL